MIFYCRIKGEGLHTLDYNTDGICLMDSGGKVSKEFSDKVNRGEFIVSDEDE